MIGMGKIALVGALATCMAGIGGYFYGVDTGVDKERAEQLSALTDAQIARDRLQRRVDALTIAAQAHEVARQNEARTIIRETQKLIHQPVYRTVCIDNAGVGLLDRATANANGEAVAAPAGPATPAASGPAQ